MPGRALAGPPLAYCLSWRCRSLISCRKSGSREALRVTQGDAKAIRTEPPARLVLLTRRGGGRDVKPDLMPEARPKNPTRKMRTLTIVILVASWVVLIYGATLPLLATIQVDAIGLGLGITAIVTSLWKRDW